MSSSPLPAKDPSSDDQPDAAAAAADNTTQPPPAVPAAEAVSPPPSPPSPTARTPPPSPPSPPAKAPPASPIHPPAAQAPPAASVPPPAEKAPPADSIPFLTARSPPPPLQRPPPSPPAPVKPAIPGPQQTWTPLFTSPPENPLPPLPTLLPPPASHQAPPQSKPSPQPPEAVPASSLTKPDDVGDHAASSRLPSNSAITPPRSQPSPSSEGTTVPSRPAIIPSPATRSPENVITSPRDATPTSRATPPDPLPSPPPRSNNSAAFLGITIAGVLTAVVLAIAIFLAILWRRESGKNAQQRKKSAGRSSPNASPATENLLGIHVSPEAVEPGGSKRCWAYEELDRMTDGFSAGHLVGEGGFGSVYKAVLDDGVPIAVKQLKAGSRQGGREFRAEVETISRIHHRHLVSLVGYCIEESQRLLVFEFLPNDTLDHHLHRKELPVLEWANRMKIAIGSARGLTYLHEDCNPRIIHRDIKSANILLDESFEAKVADFGLARLTDDANTHVSTRVMGTFGYLAPEYAISGKLTDRSDVYSFGVVLLELITGREPIDQTLPSGDGSLVEWARPLLLHALKAGGEYDELVDPRLENNFSRSEMLQMIEAAAACVRHSAHNRPRMLQVLRALDCGGSLPNLCNGVKLGESTTYDSSEYAAEIEGLRRLVDGSDSCTFDCDLSEEVETGIQQSA